MKKFLVCVLSLFMVFVPFIGGKAGALGCTERRAETCAQLAQMIARLYTKNPDFSFDDEKCSNGAKVAASEAKKQHMSFSQYRNFLSKQLGDMFKSGDVSLNCHAFASYAFNKFSEKEIPCYFLNIKFIKKNYGHAVVLIPQKESTGTAWYICDFHSATSIGDMNYLFMPFEQYINQLNMVSRCGCVQGISVINPNCEDYSNTQDYRDLRTFLWDIPEGMQEAKNIASWENEHYMLELQSGMMHRVKDACILCNLYKSVSTRLEDIFKKSDIGRAVLILENFGGAQVAAQWMSEVTGGLSVEEVIRMIKSGRSLQEILDGAVLSK